jgi:hypothetical protein
MVFLAAAVFALVVPQDEAKLKEAWPKLAEAWKAVEEYKPAPEAGTLDDAFLAVAAKLHGAFEAAGLFTTDGEYLPQALKALVKTRARTVMPSSPSPWGNRAIVFRRRVVAGGAPGWEAGTADADPLATLLASIKKLESLKKESLDDEENVQDELATARKAMKALGITADDTPPALRRRALHLVKALALGEGYPAPAVATDEQAKQVRAWISDLGNEAIDTREGAMKELLRAGEAALPFVREALKGGDAEVASRAKKILGYGHAPWTQVKAQDPAGLMFDAALAVPAAPVAPPPPPAPAPAKEEKK